MADAVIQAELPLPLPELSDDLPLLPARMINEFVYCPRLAYLEWVQGEWAESADTVEGRHRHKRVDQRKGNLPPADDGQGDEPIHASSVTLSSERLGVIAKMDLIEGEGNVVSPVDYKRGKRPHVPKGAYDPERVQVCIQGMILEDHGYTVEEGVLYYVESRERVRVEFDDELRDLAMSAINGMRLIAAGGRMPPPLEDSPKCSRCSLAAICLPDEVNLLRRGAGDTRPLAVHKVDALPLYVQAYKAKVGKKGETLEVTVEDERVAHVRLIDTSQLVLQGNVYLTTPALHELMARDIPVSWHSYGGWFLGHTVGVGHKNVELRTAQYAGSFDEQICLRLARGLVRAKILNCRTLLRRNWREGDAPDQALTRLQQSAAKAARAGSLQELLGVEGNAAAIYFSHFSGMLKRETDEQAMAFDFNTRSRRPPTDPVNALLSYAYSLLVRAWTVTLSAVGFDPYRGFYHQPRYGRPALALDMMEPFRALIAESAVLMAINNGEIKSTDFIGGSGSVNLSSNGRKRFIAAFERRMSQEVTHPLFGYKVAYRRLLELQARLLSRSLLGDILEYPDFTTR